MIIKDKNKLQQKCKQVTDFNNAEKIAAELLNELSNSKTGIGLAANQIGYDKRICVVNVKEPIVLINPKIIDKLRYCYVNNIDVMMNTAASQRKKEWYIKAFKANPNATWIFGIDGLPSESHKYRVNQHGVKLFNIMKMAASMDIDTVWQYLVFDYNKDHIDEAKVMCGNKITFLLRTPRDFQSGPS